MSVPASAQGRGQGPAHSLLCAVAAVPRLRCRQGWAGGGLGLFRPHGPVQHNSSRPVSLQASWTPQVANGEALEEPFQPQTGRSLVATCLWPPHFKGGDVGLASSNAFPRLFCAAHSRTRTPFKGSQRPRPSPGRRHTCLGTGSHLGLNVPLRMSPNPDPVPSLVPVQIGRRPQAGDTRQLH